MSKLTRRKSLQLLTAAPMLWLPRKSTAAGEAAVTLPAPALIDPASGLTEGWTMAVLPDSQNYAKYAKNQEHFVRMCRWLAEHLEKWRIRMVLHEGDFVEQNGIPEGGGQGWGDQNGESQWHSAKRALSLLEGKVPIIYATGNHDYGLRNAETRETRFNEFFGVTSNPLISDGKGGGILVECASNAFGVKTLENAAYQMSAPDGRKLLVISLEWGPRRAVVDWAREVLARPAFANHTGIFLTHDFVIPGDLRDGQDGNRKRSGNPHTYPTGKAGDTHDGEDLWNALIKPASQVELVLNGHEMRSHVGRRTDANASGRAVHQMLFNAQGFGGGSDEKGNGGDGWLRLLTFEPDGRTLSVRTFSPLKLDAGKSPWWDHPQWRFTLPLRAPV